MYKNPDDARAYFKNRYQSKKQDYKNNMNNYWYRKAQEKYGVQEPTEEQIKETRNEYYRQYRKDHPVETKQTMERFYENWAENNKED